MKITEILKLDGVTLEDLKKLYIEQSSSDERDWVTRIAITQRKHSILLWLIQKGFFNHHEYTVAAIGLFIIDNKLECIEALYQWILSTNEYYYNNQAHYSEKAFSGLIFDVRNLLISPYCLTENNRDEVNLLMFASSLGRTEIVNFLLDKGAISNLCNTKDKNKTALMYAIENDHIDTALALISHPLSKFHIEDYRYLIKKKCFYLASLMHDNSKIMGNLEPNEEAHLRQKKQHLEERAQTSIRNALSSLLKIAVNLQFNITYTQFFMGQASGAAIISPDTALAASNVITPIAKAHDDEKNLDRFLASVTDANKLDDIILAAAKRRAQLAGNAFAMFPPALPGQVSMAAPSAPPLPPPPYEDPGTAGTVNEKPRPSEKIKTPTAFNS